ncbi:glycosyltransferase [soil metagenome]
MENNPVTDQSMPLTPVVTVICLCYNQQDYVKEAICSVLNQDYKNIELMVVDDASTDHSPDEILKVIKDHPEISFIQLEKNVGNCRAFNTALFRAKGSFIIDLAADDVLLPERISTGVVALEAAGPDFGVNFTDAALIDENSIIIGYHYRRDTKGKLLDSLPQGDVYQEILSRYFICPPTMMARKEVFEQLNGYDESLAYEDFDFFVRSSRNFNYCYTDKVLVQKRILADSLSSKQYKPESQQLLSTYLICSKAFELNRSKEEHLALQKRIRYELRQAILSNNYKIATKFLSLYKKINPGFLYLTLMKILIFLKPNLSFVNRLRIKIKMMS